MLKVVIMEWWEYEHFNFFPFYSSMISIFFFMSLDYYILGKTLWIKKSS